MPRAPFRAGRRLPALALLVALSGAVGLGTPALAREHRCECPAHGDHDCDCPLCALRLARLAADAEAPPCHRISARTRVAEERARKARPCLKGDCDEGAAPAVAASLDPFVPPARLRLERAGSGAWPAPAPQVGRVRPRTVELPPPRLG